MSPIFSLYAVVTSCKNQNPSCCCKCNSKPKIRNVLCIDFSHNLKNFILCLITSKLSFSIKSLWYCNLTQKAGKFRASIFDKTRKTSFWANFRPILAQKPQIKKFPEKFIKLNLSLYAAITSIKTSKFESTFNNIRIENIILAPIRASFFYGVSSTKCYTLSQAAILCNTKENQWTKLQNDKKTNFEPNFGPQGFFAGFSLLAVRHCSKLSFYAILRKANELNLRK